MLSARSFPDTLSFRNLLEFNGLTADRTFYSRTQESFEDFTCILSIKSFDWSSVRKFLSCSNLKLNSLYTDPFMFHNENRSASACLLHGIRILMYTSAAVIKREGKQCNLCIASSFIFTFMPRALERRVKYKLSRSCLGSVESRKSTGEEKKTSIAISLLFHLLPHIYWFIS